MRRVASRSALRVLGVAAVLFLGGCGSDPAGEADAGGVGDAAIARDTGAALDGSTAADGATATDASGADGEANANDAGGAAADADPSGSDGATGIDAPAPSADASPEDARTSDAGPGDGGAPVPECSDGRDNDGDGLVDWQLDLGCHGPGDPHEAARPRADENGWTTFDPAMDTRIIYVSSSTGADSNDGLSPRRPVRTIARGLSLLRSGRPDWLLLRRGDTWLEAINFGSRSGASATDRMVIASYGDGPARPLLKTGDQTGISICCSAQSHVAFLDLDLYAHTRDPSSPEFVGSAGSDAVRRCCAGGENILIEGSSFRFYTTLVLQTGDQGVPRNIELRRSVVADNYSASGHSQGTYASHVDGLLIEENVYDHNGWNTTVPGGEATMFNHNTYLNGNDVTLRGNLFLRASSMGNKFRSDDTGGMNRVLVEDNFYLEGEIGVGIGGNTTEPSRFRDVRIQDNVFMYIGRTQPTNRDLAWYLEIADNERTTVARNYFLSQTALSNAYAVRLSGGTNRDVTIEDNLAYDMRQRAFMVGSGGTYTSIRFTNNRIQSPGVTSFMFEHTGNFSTHTFSGNVYSSSSPMNAWFRVGNQSMSFQDWVMRSGETGARVEQLVFPDPGRNLDQYHGTLRRTATQQAFIDEAKKQSKLGWRPEYAAPAVNDYIRAGFGP